MSETKQRKASKQVRPPGMTSGHADPSKGRQPIPVGVLIFQGDMPSGVPGRTGSSSITDRRHRTAGPQAKHEIEHHPWIRSFLVTHFPRDKPPKPVFVPEARVQLWHPLDPK